MTVTYLAQEPDGMPDTIVFSRGSSPLRELATIERQHGSMIHIDDVNYGNSQVNPRELLHALLEAINQGWYYPNPESIRLMKEAIDTCGIANEEVAPVDDLFIH